MNFTYVRIGSIALAMLALVSLRSAAAAEGALVPPRVVIAIVDPRLDPADLAAVPGMSLGTMSAGIGVVPAVQTYLDISQGNRVSKDLYDDRFPPAVEPERDGVPPDQWRHLVDRAGGAPADVVPGLLAQSLREAGIAVRAASELSTPSLIAADENGRIDRAPRGGCGARGCGPGVSVLGVSPAELAAIAEALRGDDLLIAIEEPPRKGQPLDTIGVAGADYEGLLTSRSTRTDGLVLSTDIGPTVLERYGIAAPGEMNGREITAEGSSDAADVDRLERRLTERPSRYWVVLAPLAIWLGLSGLAAAIGRRRAARVALSLLGLSCVWAPALLLVGAAADASEAAQALIVGVGSVALALAARALFSASGGLAVACGVTVLAYAVDVAAGSSLTAFSVLGPNPGGGIRFFGIGNELEAALTTLTLVGTGAGLAAAGVGPGRRAAVWFGAMAAIAALAYAPGRFGADVGAAIVLGAGGAAAAALALGFDRRRLALAVVAVPALALALVIGIDLVIGGGAHLTASVLGAGGTDQLGDVLQRRIDLTVRSFTNPAYPIVLAIVVVLFVAGIWKRDGVLSWFGDRSAARFGFLGASVGVIVGTLANDSGSLLLTIGGIYLATLAGYFWATGAQATPSTPAPESGRALG